MIDTVFDHQEGTDINATQLHIYEQLHAWQQTFFICTLQPARLLCLLHRRKPLNMSAVACHMFWPLSMSVHCRSVEQLCASAPKSQHYARRCCQNRSMIWVPDLTLKVLPSGTAFSQSTCAKCAWPKVAKTESGNTRWSRNERTTWTKSYFRAPSKVTPMPSMANSEEKVFGKVVSRFKYPANFPSLTSLAWPSNSDTSVASAHNPFQNNSHSFSCLSSAFLFLSAASKFCYIA